MRAAVFLDKDGTLVEDVPYNVDPARLRFAEGAIPALDRLSRAGYALVVATNQPGLALGRFSEQALRGLVAHLGARLAAAGVPLAGFYFCPHAPPPAGCPCRKPRSGLLRRAAADLALDLSRSWMVGDILDDVEAGARAGCRTVLLDVGSETEWRRGPGRAPDHTVPDLGAAADAILGAAAERSAA